MSSAGATASADEPGAPFLDSSASTASAAVSMSATVAGATARPRITFPISGRTHAPKCIREEEEELLSRFLECILA